MHKLLQQNIVKFPGHNAMVNKLGQVQKRSLGEENL